MCKFCDLEPLKKDYSSKPGYYYFTEDYELMLYIRNENFAADRFCYLKMNYCPICGKKLGE